MTVNYKAYFILHKYLSTFQMKLINQLSKESGTPIHTIRYYENYGLFKGKKIAAVKSNNYTYYDEEVEDKLEMIKEAKAIGFSLSEIKVIIDTWHSKKLSIEKRKQILASKIKEIDQKIIHLKEVKKRIANVIKMVERDDC